MYRHHRNRFGLAIALLCLFIIAGCGGDDPSPTEPVPETSDLNCGNPALGAATAQPFDRVEVTGISGIGDATWVAYEAPSGATGITAVLVDGDGRAEIVVPPNIDDLLNGGTVQLTVTDGIESCAALEIEVMPLEPAVGDPLGDAVAALDELTLALAAQFGLDPGVLAATSLADLPPQAIPVALLLEARAAIDPATALNDLTSDEAAFLQALLAKIDLATALGDLTATSKGLNGSPTPSPAFLKTAAASGLKECGDLGAVPADLFDLNGPQELSDFIKAARGASDSLGPLSQNIGNLGTAFAVLGLVSPPVGAIAGWMAFSMNLVQQMRANLYPSAISRLEFQVDTDRIEEDWDLTRGDPPIKWSFAKVWATNNGMGLARVGLDLITTAAALPGGFGGAVADAATGGLDILGKEALNIRLGELEDDPDGGAECWGIGVTEFGPVVIDDGTGERWVTAETFGGNAVLVNVANVRKLDPEEIGTVTLRVQTQPEPFPGPMGFEDKPVEVVRKEVVWIPRTLLVENPGETVTIKFRVDNSKHNKPEDIQLTPGPGLPPLTPTFSGGVHTLTFVTPSEADAYPTYIEVCSMSKELPPDSPARCGRIEIFADERVVIEKKDVCVGSGQSETFTATAGGPGELTVMWEIETGAGDLSNTSGLSVDYTAPSSGSGEVTLRAYLESKPEVEDRITFRYGVCSGLAVYYGNLVEINFPLGSGGACGNPDLDDQFEEITFPEEGLLPLVAPAPGDVWVGRSETFSHRLFDGGVFGDMPMGGDQCVYGTFNANAGYTGTLTGSADGTRLDIDIETDAASNCQDLGTDLGMECSSAVAMMSIAGRFDFDITTAANFRLKVNLSCDSYSPPGFPPLSGMVSIIAVQVEPDGTFAPVNATTQPIQVQCSAGNPVVVDRLMQFATPSAAGQTDHVMVMFQMDNTSIGALPTDTGEVRRTGFLQGFISVDRE
ncbi:MAG: hypothetical protein ABFS42_05860 [Candidatus Krumholzibacteriota bacterium]